MFSCNTNRLVEIWVHRSRCVDRGIEYLVAQRRSIKLNSFTFFFFFPLLFPLVPPPRSCNIVSTILLCIYPNTISLLEMMMHTCSLLDREIFFRKRFYMRYAGSKNPQVLQHIKVTDTYHKFHSPRFLYIHTTLIDYS